MVSIEVETLAIVRAARKLVSRDLRIRWPDMRLDGHPVSVAAVEKHRSGESLLAAPLVSEWIQRVEIDGYAWFAEFAVKNVEFDVHLSRAARQESMERKRQIIFKTAHQFLRVLFRIGMILPHPIKPRPPHHGPGRFESAVRHDICKQLFAFARIENCAHKSCGNAMFKPCASRKLVVLRRQNAHFFGLTERCQL